MAYEAILLDIKDGVATITLNRPEKLNAFSPRMTAELYGAFAELENNDDARVIVVTGTGRAFSAGADLSSDGSTFNADARRTRGEMPQARPIRPWEMKKPTIAAINGPS